jgi:hypothetical protein
LDQNDMVRTYMYISDNAHAGDDLDNKVSQLFRGAY